MPQNEKGALFTPEEAQTVRTIKEKVIHHPQLNQVLQDIISVFAVIRSKVAMVEQGGVRKQVSIHVDEHNQFIRLRKESSRIHGRLLKVLSVFSGSAECHSEDLIFSLKGFSHRTDTESGTIKIPTEEKAECLKLLRSFHAELIAIHTELESQKRPSA